MFKLKQTIINLIPPKYRFKLVSLKNIFHKFKQVYYSQNGEDIVLKSLFPKNYKGFYVDVGAHHPYRISNTYLLFKRGWRGINIDANPETISLFKRARPDDINLCLGVSNSSGTLTYHEFSDPAVNTFSKEAAEKFKNKSWIKYLGTSKIKTDPLKEILSKFMPANTKIDLLSIDVEGLDLEVLQSNDWNIYSPQVVVVETHDFSIETKDVHPLYSFLKEKDYELIGLMKFSMIFKIKKRA